MREKSGISAIHSKNQRIKILIIMIEDEARKIGVEKIEF
jgi:hypothetical protein